MLEIIICDATNDGNLIRDTDSFVIKLLSFLITKKPWNCRKTQQFQGF